MIWPPFGTVDQCSTWWSDRHVVLLTSALLDDLTAMWYCWPVQYLMIWPPCGTVDQCSTWWSDRHVVLLTGAMLNELTPMWHHVDWWNVCMIWPRPHVVVFTGGLHDDLTTMWYCADWWTARWSAPLKQFDSMWFHQSSNPPPFEYTGYNGDAKC